MGLFYRYSDFETLLFGFWGQTDPGPTDPDIAWVSFDLEEHKIHNNVSLVIEHSEQLQFHQLQITPNLLLLSLVLLQ